jgi:hypothetical protein
MSLRDGLNRLYPWIEGQVNIAFQAGLGLSHASTKEQKAA